MFNFDNIEEVEMTNFKGGQKSVFAKMIYDGKVRIMKARLPKGSSIGYHIHTASAEVVYCLSGKADVIFNGENDVLTAGNVHYCPEGQAHSMTNNQDEDLVVICVVPEF